MIQNLPYETLKQAYQDSIKFSLDKEFIELLEKELKRREAAQSSKPSAKEKREDANRPKLELQLSQKG